MKDKVAEQITGMLTLEQKKEMLEAFKKKYKGSPIERELVAAMKRQLGITE